jgi:hypothetical protein
MDPLPRVSMVNVDPARMPVSAQLLQGIRRVVLEPADKMRDTDAILAEVATAVMELETYVGELSRSASATSRRGLMVSAHPSSVAISITSAGSLAMVNGPHGLPVVMDAIARIVQSDLPIPSSPTSRLTFPAAR